MFKIKILLMAAASSCLFLNPALAELQDGNATMGCNMHSNPNLRDEVEAVSNLDIIFNVPSPKAKEVEAESIQ